MRPSESRQLKVSDCRLRPRLDAWEGLVARSSCGHSSSLMVLSRRRIADQFDLAVGVTVQVGARLRSLPVGCGPVAAKLIVDVATGDFGQLFRKPRFHHLQSRASWRWTEGMASSPLQVVMVVTGGALFDTQVVIVVVAGAVVEVAALVVCREWRSHFGQRSHGGVNVGSTLKRAAAGRLPAPVRCRVPCWRDASP